MRKRGSFRHCYFILLLSIFFIILGRTGYSDSLNMNYVGGFLCHRVVETHATTDTLYIATEELVVVVDITDKNYPYQKGFIELDASVYSIDIV